MTLGDGIVWSSTLIVSAICVWAISRAKKWKLVAKVLAVVVIASTLVFGAFVGKRRYDNRARSLDGLWGIKFGATPLDVQILKGAADDKDEPEKDGENIKLTRLYGLNAPSQLIHLVVFKNNKASIICSIGGEYLFGFTGATTEDEIVKKFGPPPHTSIRSDGLAKAISYKKYSVGFEIEKGVLKQICADSGGELTYSNEYKPDASESPTTSGAASDAGLPRAQSK